MEMVAASKMRRAQQATLASRAYAEKSWQVLNYVAAQPGRGKTLHPLLEEREQVKNILVILMTSDRGLCGAFNMNILRTTFDFIKQSEKPVKMVTVGRRGRDLAMRSGKEIIAEFTGLSEKPKMLDIGPIANIAIEEFTAGRVDQVEIAYTDFVNVIKQVPQVKQLLPIVTPKERPADASAVYLYEPNPEAILDSILPRFTELQIYQALLESVASEHSARMVAMRNATENARELIDGLSLVYNKARQWNITKEMLDIAGGAEALRQALCGKIIFRIGY